RLSKKRDVFKYGYIKLPKETPMAPPHKLSLPVLFCLGSSLGLGGSNFSKVSSLFTLYTVCVKIQEKGGNNDFQNEFPLSKIYFSSSIVIIQYLKFFSIPLILHFIHLYTPIGYMV